MGVWGDQVVPRVADRSLRGHELGALREQACAPLQGRVLETGFGSGWPRGSTGSTVCTSVLPAAAT